jgi:zinc and cadmium transporter
VAFNCIILFTLTFLAGATVFVVPDIKNKNFNTLLSFSGAYLFSMTVIHILPELFYQAKNASYIGIFVLIGFFFQILLDYFSTGVEHGHIHTDGHEHHSYKEAAILFISLWIHSFLEGSLLVHPHSSHAHADVFNLLFGLILHKLPESFALIAVLLFQLKNKILVWVLLFVFALSSPLGFIVSESLSNSALENSQWFTYLFAFVAGNFLHISTTIFFESESSQHSFKGNKLIITSAGALLAILAELL